MLDEFYRQMSANYFAWISGFASVTMANDDRPALAQHFAETLKAIRPDIAQSVAKIIFQSDYRSIVGQVNKPTLIIQSQNDFAVPGEVAKFLHENIQGSMLKFVDAEGHFPHISAPKEVITAIRSFI